MRSSFAFILHGFALPFGAVTGTRLVFDGDLGAIFVYDSNNFLIGQIQGLAGNMTIRAAAPSGAVATLTAQTGAAFLVLGAPDFAGHTLVDGSLTADTDSGTQRLYLLIRSGTIDGGAEARAFFIGEDGTHNIPKISFDGGNNLPVNFIVNRRAVPLGILPNGKLRVTTDDVAIAPGFDTDMSVTVDVDSARGYKVTLSSGVAWATAGAQYFVDLHDGTSIVGRFYLAPANTTVAFSTDAHIQTTVDYFPGTTGTKTLSVRNGAASGGNITMKRGLNISFRSLTISDNGALGNQI